MSLRLRRVLFACGGITTLVLLLLAWLYWAAGYVPESYRAALEADPATLAQRSDKMLKQATDFASDVKHAGRWEAVFTAEEINGWLAVDLVQNHPDALPAGLCEPRVAIVDGRILIFCRYRSDVRDTVLTLELEPYLPEPNVLAVRIVKARAGRLPLPIGDHLTRISEWARKAEMRLEWRHADGDPVAMVHVPSSAAAKGKKLRIESLHVGDGRIHVAGVTTRAP